jgi:hypothetical protein
VPQHAEVNRDVTKKEHPEAVRPLLPEISEFAKHNHFNVLHPVLQYVYLRRYLLPLFLKSGRLLALGLELPEDAFVNIHGWNAVGETYGMHKYIMSLYSGS